MNLPVGEIIEQGLDLAKIAMQDLLASFVERGFSGYVVTTVWGYSGVEEGVFLFRQGFLAGAFFEYLGFGVTYLGDYSLQHVFNSFAAQRGVVDIVGLSVQQVDLIMAFNEKLKVTAQLDKRSIAKYMAEKYSEKFAQTALLQSKSGAGETKSIFKKLGLAELQ